MFQNKVGQSPERPIYKVLAFETDNQKVGKDDVMTLVDASQSDFFRPVFETYLVGTEGMDLPSDVSQYTTASDSSHLDGNVDRWIHGSEGPMSMHVDTTGVQSSGVAVAQRSTLTSPSIRAVGWMWYFFGLLLSICNYFVQTPPGHNNCSQQRTSSPTRCVANAFDQLCHQVRLYCRSISMACAQILQKHLATNFIASVLDVILFVYALAFLVLSMYRI